MSTNVGSIHYDLSLDTSKFDKASAGLTSKMNSIGSGMTDIGKKMTLGVTLPVVAGFAYAVKSASDLNETLNKVEVAFGANAKEVKAWSKTSINSMGLAQQSALDATALFGDMATSMGLSTKEASTMSMSLTQLGADLASFKNISFSEAQTALAGVFTGETESLKRLGIVMTETNLLEYARSKGITKTVQEMTQAEKVQLRYNYIMEKTKNSQGDFIRTSGGTANQIRITQERFKQLSAEIGANFLPIANKILGVIQKVITKFQELSPKQQNMILMFLGIMAVVGPLLIVIGSLVSAIATLANPIGLAILVIGLLIAGLTYLQMKYQAITKALEFLQPVINTVTLAFQWLIAKLAQELAPIIQFVKQHIEGFKQVAIALFAIALIPLIFIVTSTIAILFALIAVVTIVIRIFNQIVGVINWVAGTFGGLWGTIARVMGGIISAVWGMQSAVIGAFYHMAGTIVGVMGGLWGAMYNAGVRIIQGLVSGINAMGSAPANAIKGILSRVRNMLPFSPAKEGPFSGKGWTLFSGQSMMQGLADGVKSMANLPQEAIEKAMAGSFQASQFNVNNQPMKAPLQPAVNETNINGNITLGDSGAVDNFFNRINRNGELARKGLTTL